MTISGYGWGQEAWGVEEWGGDGIPPAPTSIPPVITPLDPTEGEYGVSQSIPITVRLTDDRHVVGSSITVAVNGVYYVMAGIGINGATMLHRDNDTNGYDIQVVLPDLLPLSSLVTVVVAALDIDGNRAVKEYHFTVGIGLRLISVRNPAANILVAQFNRPLLRNDEFYLLANWVVTPVVEGVENIELLEVLGNTSQSSCAYLRYEWGDSATYLLTVANIKDSDGNQIETNYNSKEFDLLFPDDEIPTTYLFDTLIGPIGMQKGPIRRRTIDRHTANRSLSLGMNEQFRLRVQTVDEAYVKTTPRPGVRRT